MQSLPSETILWLWDSIAGFSHPGKAVGVLHAAGLGSTDDIYKWHLGYRDSELLRLRMETFGKDISCIDSCPECNETVEMDVHIPDLLSQASQSSESPSDGHFSVSYQDLQFNVRKPTSLDIENLLSQSQDNRSRHEFILQCVENSELSLSKRAVNKIEQEMEKNDPLADIRFLIKCPKCHNEWNALFDIVSVFWHELATEAQKMLSDIHIIASAYHWSETDILSLSPQRRSYYLGCISE